MRYNDNQHTCRDTGNNDIVPSAKSFILRGKSPTTPISCTPVNWPLIYETMWWNWPLLRYDLYVGVPSLRPLKVMLLSIIWTKIQINCFSSYKLLWTALDLNDKFTLNNIIGLTRNEKTSVMTTPKSPGAHIWQTRWQIYPLVEASCSHE